MFFKKINIDIYKNLINKIIFNEQIKEEIIDKINYFNKNGEIVLDGYNLYAKCKNGKDFLELKYENKYFLCTYTDWKFSKFVTISEKNLKNNFVKLERKEKVEIKCNDNNNNNMTETEELEEIYGSDKSKVYESKLTKDIEYNTYYNNIEYIDNHYFTNYFDLNKKWYISNGSIINYSMSKSFMNERDELNERYSICPGAYYDEFQFATIYNFVELDKELFKEFMSGKISIEDLLVKIPKPKILTKNNSEII